MLMSKQATSVLYTERGCSYRCNLVVIATVAIAAIAIAAIATREFTSNHSIRIRQQIRNNGRIGNNGGSSTSGGERNHCNNDERCLNGGNVDQVPREIYELLTNDS
jgi:hypothetical protein